MRALITGAAGFAGGYLARACACAGDEVVGLVRHGDAPAGESVHVDLRDEDAVRAAVRDAAPDVVYHLAALSHVGQSWQRPAATVLENVASSVALLEAVRFEAPRARVVWVSSCQVYGSPDVLPVPEEAPLRPDNPYGVSKAAGEQLAVIYRDAHGLDLVVARPFNHTGPGQAASFIVSSLARQGAAARLAGAARIAVETGTAQTRRDFTDVRDVVRAYRLLAERGGRGIFNVSSGRSVSAAEHVTLLARLIAPIEVEHVVDHERVRPHEMPDLRGAPDRIFAATGWRAEIPLEQTMRETIEWWERDLASAGTTADAGTSATEPGLT